jgi:hypothetical protein
MPGWRRSAVRTRLHANSLLTGNLTGKFAIFGPKERIGRQKSAGLQGVSEEFPTEINRENSFD